MLLFCRQQSGGGWTCQNTQSIHFLKYLELFKKYIMLLYIYKKCYLSNFHFNNRTHYFTLTILYITRNFTQSGINLQSRVPLTATGATHGFLSCYKYSESNSWTWQFSFSPTCQFICDRVHRCWLATQLLACESESVT